MTKTHDPGADGARAEVPSRPVGGTDQEDHAAPSPRGPVPTLATVDSSNLHAIGYDPGATPGEGALFVQFKTGGLYRYGHVTPDQFTALAAAESKGAHVRRFVANPDHPCEFLGKVAKA